MKNMSDYFDSLGLIGHLRPDMPGFDFGDSCREWGTYSCGFKIRQNSGTLEGWWPNASGYSFKRAVDDYQISPGVFVRHPNPPDLWQKDPKEFSRDQWTGLMCGLIMNDMDWSRMVISLLLSKQKPFTFQNGDLMTFEWSFYIRGARSSRFYLLLPILDLGLVVNSLFRVISALLQPHETAPDINHTTSLAVAYFVMPTPVSWLARQLYRMRRGGILTAWQEYHNPTRFPAEAPPLDDLWGPIIEVLF